MTSIITRHLSAHHAVQGEAEYVERHVPVTASHTPPKETAMTTYMQRDGRITSAATDDMPERIWLDADSYNGAVGFAHPEKHKKDGWPGYLRFDLCASGQQVRALEWDEYRPGCFFGRTEFGDYAIAPSASAYHAGEIRISGLDGGFTYAADIESAKAAAQADYERRILAGLTPDPQAEGQVRTLDPRVSLLEDLSAEDFLKDVDGCIDAGSDREDKTLDEIAALTPTGWQPIETAPHETLVVLGWYEGDVWKQEIALASAGNRYPNGCSDRWQHGRATHWTPLPAAPEAEGGSDER